MKFSGKYIIITGATSGIGKALATAYAKEKATVILIGSSQEKLVQTAKELAEFATIHPLQANLANSEEVQTLGKQILSLIPRVDILIHSAGVFHSGSFSQISSQMLDEQYFVNVKAPFLLTQQLLPTLHNTQGQIVFINSSAVQHVSLNNSSYAATKAALKTLADGLRLEVNPTIRVLSVYPGRTATPMQERIFATEKKTYQPEKLLQPEAIAVSILSAIALPHSAEITELFIRPTEK